MSAIFDVENMVFSAAAGKLRETVDGIFVTGEYVDAPAKFPAVSIIEVNNSIVAKMRTTNIENAAKLLYEVNIYTNTIGYKKSEAKKILEITDAAMSAMGFSRTMAQPMPNLSDATIYRIVARYEGIVMAEQSADETIYRIYSG